MDIISLALQVSFYGVFLIAVYRLLRRRGRVELAVLAVFGSTAATFAAQAVGRMMPEIAALANAAATALLIAQPVFIIWLVHLIRPQPRWLLAFYVAGFAIATAGVVLPEQRLVAALVFVGLYFAAAEGAAALILLRIAQRRHGVPRTRLRIAALATLLFGVAIVAGSAGAATVAPGTDNPALFFAQLCALAAALAYLVAFLPPIWLHTVGQRAVAFDLAVHLVTAPSGTEPQVLWRELGLAALRLLGARRVEIFDTAGAALARLGGDDGSERAGPAAASDGPMTTIDVAMGREGREAPHLVAEVEGRLLFVEDDIELLRLLGTMTVRAVEREEAMIRLAEAGRQLEAAAAVRTSEARFRALLEAVPSAVLAVDAGGAIVWATGPTADLLGIDATSLTGRPLTDLLPGPDLELGVAPDQQAKVRRAELTARRADGSSLPVDVAASRFELDGRPFQLYVLSDASWRATANRLRDRFLGVLSHELRTPITSIYGGTHLLIGRGERLDTASQREVLNNVAAEAERLLRITENLVVLARIERGADFFDFRPTALRPVLRAFLAHERQLWPEMEIQLDVAAGLPLVAADEDYLAQVLRNLISNAGKYAGPSASVSISARTADGEVVVRVVDNGPGLGATDPEHIFDLYYRAAEAKEAPGAGIGLFVCRSLVEAMGGRIWARTADEGGAEFGFSLPQYVEPAEQAADAVRLAAIDRTPSASALE